MTALTGWLTDGAGEILWDGVTGEWLSAGELFFDGPTTPAQDGYQLDVCTNFVRIGQCDVFQFAGVEHRNAVGEWQATIPEGGIEFDGGATIDDVDSVIVWDTRAASIVAAGTFAPTGSVDTGLVTSVSAGGTWWTLSGVDLFGLLGQRLAYPTPTTEAPWADGYDERTGVASTVAAGYITDNLGSGAIADREISGVSVIDAIVGDTVTWTARLQPLSTLITQICNAAEIVCRPRMTEPGTIEYVLTTGADRTANTVVSEHDLAGTIKVTAAEARATFVIAGGTGGTTARTFATAATAATGIDRIESFYDVSSLTGSSAVGLAATGALSEAQAETAVEFDTLLPRQWKYRTHYDIGDTITVEVNSVRYSALVNAVAFTVNPAGTTVRPILGRTTNNEAAQIMRTLWGATARFNTNIS